MSNYLPYLKASPTSTGQGYGYSHHQASNQYPPAQYYDDPYGASVSSGLDPRFHNIFVRPLEKSPNYQKLPKNARELQLSMSPIGSNNLSPDLRGSASAKALQGGIKQIKSTRQQSLELGELRSKASKHMLLDSPTLSKAKHHKMRKEGDLSGPKHSQFSSKLKNAEDLLQRSKEMYINYSMSKGLDKMDLEDFLTDDNYSRLNKNSPQKGKIKDQTVKLPDINPKGKNKPVKQLQPSASAPIKTKSKASENYHHKESNPPFRLQESDEYTILNNSSSYQLKKQIGLSNPKSPQKAYVSFKIEVKK